MLYILVYTRRGPSRCHLEPVSLPTTHPSNLLLAPCYAAPLIDHLSSTTSLMMGRSTTAPVLAALLAWLAGAAAYPDYFLARYDGTNANCGLFPTQALYLANVGAPNFAFGSHTGFLAPDP